MTASHQAQAEVLTYEPYFGLSEKPFSLHADARFVYDSPTYAATRDGLVAGIRRREGLLVLTGQIGTGKTTLCRSVLAGLGRNTYSSLVPDPFASREDLLKMMLIDFGVLSIQELTTGSLRQASRTDLGFLLSEFLDKLPRDAFVIVIIDEAQNLSLPLIEETRILSDTFGANGQLQIVYVGQPELHAKLKSPEMRQVDQRVCGYHRLAPMDRDAVAGYVKHRLKTAGSPAGQVLFAAEMIDTLHARTGGVPRLINRICDRALLLTFQRGAEQVDREILDTALLEVGAATLSPTWDSIMFAEAAAPVMQPATVVPPVIESPVALEQVEPAPRPAEAAPVKVEAVAPPGDSVSLDIDDSFKKEVEYWVAQELGPASRQVAQRRQAANETARTAKRPSSTKASQRQPNEGRPGWARDLRSETYMQRLGRMWAKGLAIAVGLVAVLNLGLFAASYASGLVAPVMLPTTPIAPARPLPAAAPVEPDSVSAATANYLVAVGVFADDRRANQLAGELTKEGLRVLQRTVLLGGEHVQQIVLGPFFTRPEAVAELVRLQQLPGYDDANVIIVSQER